MKRDDVGSLDMFAHCETFRRVSLTKKTGAAQPDNTFSYGIAGVFTPHAHRGHGYARQLLRLLHYVIAPNDLLPGFPAAWGQPPVITGFQDASFSVLYSGVGDKYYASCKRGDGEESRVGWERIHVTSRIWEVPAEGKEVAVKGKWLGLEDLEEYEETASRSMEAEVRKMDAEKEHLAILPRE